MPYVPPNLSRADQTKQFLQQHPDVAQLWMQAGITPDMSESERGDAIAKMDPSFKADWENGDLTGEQIKEKYPALFPFTERSIMSRKKEYYSKHPDQDPQSTTSKIMEFLGLDEPYTSDSRSYDYGQKKWQQSLDEGNPDLSWMFPEATDSVNEVISGSMDDPWGNPDPRSDKDKWAGSILDFLNIPMLGFQDEGTAYVSSLVNGTTYEEELQKIRDRQDQDALHTPLWSKVGHMGAALPLDAPMLVGGAALLGRGGSALGKAAGMAAPSTRIGKAAAEMAPVSGAIGAEDATWQFGNGRDGFQNRAEGYSPEWGAIAVGAPLAGSILGGMYEAGKGAVKARRAAAAARRAGKAPSVKPGSFKLSEPNGGPRLSSPRPTGPDFPVLPVRPSTPPPLRPRAPADPDPTIRDDLERAILKSRTRDRG